MKSVTHEEMLEMASLGAKVLHPRSVYFAMRYQVPLVVKSTFQPEIEGTWIVKENKEMEAPVVTGVACKLNESRITLKGVRGGVNAIATMFSLLGDAGIFIDLISQSDSSAESTDISFTVSEDKRNETISLLKTKLNNFNEITSEVNRAKVSVVGLGMRYHTGVASRIFNALAKENINVEMISSSEIKVSVVVDAKYAELAVRSLHQAFVEEHPEMTKFA
jgi:aspartate kinase